tara:strand:+ start:664 stop:816 length:153 start_codon:yes stop_codon:yes gene_type:complete
MIVPGRYRGVVPAVIEVPKISDHSNLRLLKAEPMGNVGNRLKIKKKASIK